MIILTLISMIIYNIILDSVSYLNMDIDNFSRRCLEFNYFDIEFLALLKDIIIEDIFNKNVNLFLTKVDLILGKRTFMI